MKKALFACALGALLLGGCGSGGDGDGGPVAAGQGPGTDDAAIADDATGLPGTVIEDADADPTDGTIGGRVLEVSLAPGVEVPLAGVEIELRRLDDDRVVADALSDADGAFAFAGLARRDAYRVTLSIDGYLDESVAGVRLPPTGGAVLEPVRLVSDDNAGTGGLSGTVVGAVSGEPRAGLELLFRRGIGVRTGDVDARATTDAAGTYLVTDLDYGNYTCVIAGPGLQTIYTTVTVLGGLVRDERSVAVPPRVAAGDTTIVLTWGAAPADLDSHLTGPDAEAGGPPFHVHFGNKEAPGATLDIDDARSYGPETITAEIDGDGPYRYSVHNYSGGAATALMGSDATVRVIRDTGVVAEFFVPRGEGDLWTVFDVVGGEIVPIDTIGVRRSVDDHFAPELRSAKTGHEPVPLPAKR